MIAVNKSEKNLTPPGSSCDVEFRKGAVGIQHSEDDKIQRFTTYHACKDKFKLVMASVSGTRGQHSIGKLNVITHSVGIT